MDGPDRVSFLAVPCPRGFQLHLVILEPGDSLGYRPADWAAALVVVERGELAVECDSGERCRFGAGAILAFTELPVRRLHSVGAAPLVLSALSRDHTGRGADRHR